MPTIKKPYFGVLPLKKNQRYGSMTEAVKAKQVRYWGIKKIDTIQLNKLKPKKKTKEEKISLETLAGMIGGLGTLIRNREQKINRLKTKKENTEKDINNIAEWKKEIKKAKEKIKKLKPIYNKKYKKEQAKKEKD